MQRDAEETPPTTAGESGGRPVDRACDPVSQRLAEQLKRLPAAALVQVRTADGELLGAAPESGPDVDSAWTAFVVGRAGSLGDGDQRGWGERLAAGTLDGLVVSGPLGDLLLVRHGGRFVWLTLAPGTPAEGVEPSVRAALQQYPRT